MRRAGPLHDHLGRHPRRREPRDVPRVPRPEVPRRLRRVAQQVQEPVEGPARHRPARPQLGRRPPRRRPARRRRRRRGDLPQHRAAVLSRASCCSRGRPSPRTTRTAAPASRRTTAGSSTSARSRPAQRAGIGQIFLNDVDDAIEDATWIKEHGLRGGVLLPNVAPDVKWVKPLYDPDYDPLWAACSRTSSIPVNAARRHRLARLRQVRVGPDDHDQRGAVLRHAAVRAHAALAACSSASRG